MIATGLLSVGFAWSSTTLEHHTVSTGTLGLSFTNVSCSDPLGTIDLGEEQFKDVGWTECQLVDTDEDGDFDTLEINVYNAYPGYQVLVQDLTITNIGSVPIFLTGAELIHNDDPISVALDDPISVALEGFWTETNLSCELLDPGTGTIGELWLSLAVNQPALQNHIYTFQVEVTGEQWNWSDCAPPPERQLCGTIGFWKNWNKHETYPEEDIETWLTLIDNNSDWLGSITVNAMKAVLKKNKPMSANFLRHYLATRLDVEAGRLSLAAKHGISAFDPGNYLGLAMPSSTTLAQIVDAIESKFGTTPSDGEFEIMKNIADAINNCYDEPGTSELCDTYGKPKALTMLYTGDWPEATLHAQDEGKVVVVGDPMGATPVHIIASENSDGTGFIYFDDEVELGGTFTIDAANAGEAKLRSKTFVLVSDLLGNLLQSVEFHTSCSQPLLLGDQYGSVQLVEFFPDVGQGTTPPVTDDICAQYAKAKVLTMLYTGDGPDATSYSQAPGKVSVSGDPETTTPVRIVGSDSEVPSKIYFDGIVSLGAAFVIDGANAGDTSLRSKTFVLVYDPAPNGALLQTVEFHTSCSQPLVLGDQFGSVQLIGLVDKNGQGP